MSIEATRADRVKLGFEAGKSVDHVILVPGDSTPREVGAAVRVEGRAGEVATANARQRADRWRL